MPASAATEEDVMAKAVSHPIFSRLYPRIAAFADAHGSIEHRQEMLAGVRGRVVEIGAGTGSNFRHYPPEVTQVVAVEPEPRLRALAEKAATEAPVPVEVLAGLAEELPLEDDGFDVAVCSLVLCTIADVPGALAEARRVLKSGGELRFYEHVRSERPGFRRVQKVLAPLWRLPGGGCPVAAATSPATPNTPSRRRASPSRTSAASTS
ncbi:class I SAM-dependent methyltransferase [Streptomyces sp. TRM68367]|uniref:class I SAM-dependent methyltransferase n=1 Tax=Streptomyces sp. TRM68367 TaxID=2758415 RepID=UPI00293471B8|nr:class I SAM-dependent methyltransferase [Streptomyces sp. TRM68367]